MGKEFWRDFIICAGCVFCGTLAAMLIMFGISMAIWLK